MLCSSGFNFTSWILDFVPALVTHAKCESSCRGASPSPSGRGWPEGPGEGRLVKNVAHSGPHPPLRGTLSRRERDSLQPLPTTANVQTPVSQRERDRALQDAADSSQKVGVPKVKAVPGILPLRSTLFPPLIHLPLHFVIADGTAGF